MLFFRQMHKFFVLFIKGTRFVGIFFEAWLLNHYKQTMLDTYPPILDVQTKFYAVDCPFFGLKKY